MKKPKETILIYVSLLDIDKFKSINDTYGHDIGDEAIKTVSTILNKNLRKTDLIARFGGEEFCILIENISLENATILLERVRQAFERHLLVIDNLQIKFTVSIGIYYGIKNTLEEMIKIADNELYFCKNNGRNQIKLITSEG